MQYTRITAEEDKARNALPKGDYPFVVVAIEDKPTKSGENNMLVVDIEIHTDSGRTKKQKDWVVYDMDSMAWKFRHFAETCGLLEKYEAGTINAMDFLGKHGVVRLTQKDFVDSDGEATVLNEVKDYVKPGEARGNQSAMNSGLPSDAPFNDDLPL